MLLSALQRPVWRIRPIKLRNNQIFYECKNELHVRVNDSSEDNFIADVVRCERSAYTLTGISTS